MEYTITNLKKVPNKWNLNTVFNFYLKFRSPPLPLGVT